MQNDFKNRERELRKLPVSIFEGMGSKAEEASDPVEETFDGFDHHTDGPDKPGLFHFGAGYLGQRTLDILHIIAQRLGVQLLQRSAEAD